MGLMRRRRIRRARRRAFVAGAAVGAAVAGSSSKGAQKVVEKDGVMYCSKCGAPYSGKSKFCPQCGALLE